MLKEDIDEETIMFKLVSMLLDRQSVKGPADIGIPAEKLTKILERLEKQGDRGGSRGRGRGGPRGRSRSGGSRDRNSSRSRRGNNSGGRNKYKNA